MHLVSPGEGGVCVVEAAEQVLEAADVVAGDGRHGAPGEDQLVATGREPTIWPQGYSSCGAGTMRTRVILRPSIASTVIP